MQKYTKALDYREAYKLMEAKDVFLSITLGRRGKEADRLWRHLHVRFKGQGNEKNLLSGERPVPLDLRCACHPNQRHEDSCKITTN